MFFKLSASLAPDIKKFIGSIIISELLHHVRRRPTERRGQFSIYIDEFQNFATSDDLAIFITEARKCGIATTIAHQERLGQLKDNKKMMGATLAAANMIFFQLTIKDAEELASIFARDPPAETRLEEQYVISQSPVWDLMKGHANPRICELVNKYIRPLKDRLTDIYGESEFERLERQDYMDEAGLFRLGSQFAGVDYRQANYDRMRGALRGAAGALMQAKEQTDKLKALSEQGTTLRKMMRDLNRFFVEVMEGKVKSGQEEYSNRLIELTKSTSLPGDDGKLLELYTALTYGDPEKDRALPYPCAKRQGLFSDHVAKTEKEMVDIREAKKAYFRKRAEEIYINNLSKIKAEYEKVFKEVGADWYSCTKYMMEMEHRSYLAAIKLYEEGDDWVLDKDTHSWIRLNIIPLNMAISSLF